ncbi:MAG: peptidoglycan-binding protein [Candidatus Azambacteria bacterium]|nr:peptidoglycan-binding protein [Candidatus Azambacteria bacterium]
MFISKREAYPIGIVLLGAALVLALSLSLAVPKAGAVTIDELMAQIQALQAQLIALQGGTTTTGTATACTFSRSLYVGVSSGADVKCLQQYLNSAGYTVSASGAGSAGSETTFYGSLTRAAVSKWQAANSVAPAVGYFGPISQAKYATVAGTTTGGTTGGTTTTPVAGGLSIALSSGTTASRTIVAGAANMAFGKWNFTAGSGNVTVTTLKFTKSGISADAEVGSAYLYDADTGDYIAQYSGLGSGVLTFTNASGLFTVNTGAVKRVELRLDVSSSASNNHTMAWALSSASDVTSNATSISGTFPSASNAMTFVTVSNPEIATLTATTVTTGSSVNAGTTGYLAGSFTLAAANSAVLLDRIVLTQNGSLISATDVGNIKLMTTGGSQIGPTLNNMSSDGTGTFVMSTAYEIPAGQTIQVNVYADVLAGVNRTLKFNVLNLRDIQARDKTYSIGVNPSGSVAMTQTSVAAGTLTITLDPSSPTGNLAPGQTNVTVAKFKVNSYGEQVKVLFVPFQLVATGVVTWTVDVDNVYLVDDSGNQIGSTITTPCSTDAGTTCTSGSTSDTWNETGTTAATFGTSASPINYLIPANTARIWSLKLDVLSAVVASDITASLRAGTSNYQGQVSLSSADTTAVSANKLTITSNPFSATLNSALGVGNLVKGQSTARIGSFVLSASSAEGINVSTITVTSSTTFPFANLFVKVSGTQFGTLTGSVAVSTNYTFAGTAPVLIPAGGNITVDVYADILSTATNLGSAHYVKLYDVSAVGALTATTQTLYGTAASAAVSGSNIIAQRNTISETGGTLTIAKDSASPAAYQAVMGQTNKSLAIWRFSGGTTSDISITDMIVTDIATSTGDPTNAKASLTDLQWYKGGVAVGPIITSGTASGESVINPLVTFGYKYTFHFTSPIVVPQNDGISLELRGSIPTFASGGSQSNSTHTLRIENPSDVTALSTSGSLTATISGPNNSSGTAVNAVTVIRTKLSVTAPTGLVTTSSHPRSSNDTVAYFDFTADSANSVVINTVTMKLGGATLATLTIKLIDADTGTAWGSTLAAGQTLGINTTLGVTATNGTSSVSFSPAYTLTAGATKRVKVVTNTNGLTSTAGNTSGSVVQMSIDTDTSGTTSLVDADGNAAAVNCLTGAEMTCNAIGWNDGTSGSLNLEAKVLPIYAPSISY